jgi:1-deoxy-D-xylulose-5-phosphate synthase
MWDISLLSTIPGLHIAAPRDSAQLRALLADAIAIDAPAAVRYPKGDVVPPTPALERVGGVDLMRGGAREGVLLAAAGAMVPMCLEAADILGAAGLAVAVADPRWIAPVPDGLAELAVGRRLVVTVEDGCRSGGFGSAVSDAFADVGLDIPVRRLGLPHRFLGQGTRSQVLAAAGLTGPAIAHAVNALVHR